ncbi:Biogenesis of lysosome-related organelles complex 1 subunit 1 [Holothuria leucospilota]|uniref:Biogenesis of lysosome-related organelles complex 1 subunit 1 n=1 Tax=Holothuria leucospilota TaxID=206669 RepID=A0A9Q0YNY1_HOLLE|nr:Biogenesis of lysosome-related organelles complex 1 subunit 1 [Holothuria leucospilota]
MLSSLVREHQAKQAARRDIQERRRKEAIISASNVTKALVENLNNRVAIAYNNEKKLDAEAKQLQANAALFAKQSMQWLQLIENFNQALKELGDVENWSKSLESDMQTIASALEYAYKDTG